MYGFLMLILIIGYFLPADDMGLGKTLTMISLVKKQRELTEQVEEDNADKDKEDKTEDKEEKTEDKDQGEIILSVLVLIVICQRK